MKKYTFEILLVVIPFLLLIAFFVFGESLLGVSLFNDIKNILYGVLASIIFLGLHTFMKNFNYWKVYYYTQTTYRNKLVYFSFAYLFRLKFKDKYLLVKSSRANHFLPLGGVYKQHKGAKTKFKSLGILGIEDSDHMRLDESEKDDLRGYIPGKHIVKFIRWFKSREDRESDHWREFYEEAIATGLLPEKNFPYVRFTYDQSNKLRITPKNHWNDPEIKIQEVFDVELTDAQKQGLETLFNQGNGTEHIWVTANDIKNRQYYRNDTTKKEDTISDNAYLLINKS